MCSLFAPRRTGNRLGAITGFAHHDGRDFAAALHAAFERRALPHAHTLYARTKRAALEEWARGIVEGAILQQAGIEGPAWWPSDLPVLAPPTQSYAI